MPSGEELPACAGSARLSLIVEEECGNVNDDPQALSNPLKEAIDAITSLAEEGDFEDSMKNLGQVSREEEDKENQENRPSDPPGSKLVLNTSKVPVPAKFDEVKKVEEVREEPCVERVYPMLGTNPLEDIPVGGKSKSSNLGYNLDKIIEPSPLASDPGHLLPCPTCERTFSRLALERHIKICQKVGTRKRNEPAAVKTNKFDPSSTPKLERKVSNTPNKRKLLKPEDEFKECPHCGRKFGPKPYDRHVAWCGEKAQRMQDSPNKDLVALAKLHARTGYRPKTPGKCQESPSRKPSFSGSYATADSPLPPSVLGDLSRSESRNSRRSMERKTSADISSLGSKDHTVETPETHFIRAMTGRGSIKRGPAPTKASQLRQLAKEKELQNKSISGNGNPFSSLSTTPEPIFQKRSSVANRSFRQPRNSVSPMMSRSSYQNRPGSDSGLMSSSLVASQNRSNSLVSPSVYSFQPVVKPSVVRPLGGTSQPSSSYRREPEGIEHDSKVSDISVGTYDHSAEYDPYQSAARQMQELLFGPGSGQSATSDFLKPSSNSAFEKYVPSTADINIKMNSKAGNVFNTNSADILDPNLVEPKRSSFLKGTASYDMNYRNGLGNPQQHQSRSSHVTMNNNNFKSPHQFSSSTFGSVGSSNSNAKVARFCHECGNPFALPNIRFCCECGVKRLYC